MTAREDRAVRWTRVLRADGWRVERRAAPSAFQPEAAREGGHVALIDLSFTRPRPAAAIARLREQAPGWRIALVTEPEEGFGTPMREALGSGADEVIPAGVQPGELRNRLAALAGVRKKLKVLETADRRLRVDLERRQAWSCLSRNRLLPLTRTEFDLLAALLESPGRVFTRQQLIERVWPDGEANAEAVDRHIGSLRRKLASLGKRIRTAHGEGYVAA